MRKLASLLILCVFAANADAQVGRVGINTTTPSAMLHVKDSAVVFTGSLSLPGTPGNPPVSGGGIRMMWYPQKAAFRAGEAGLTTWDKDSIGNYSFATGFSTKAKGQYTFVTGEQSEAHGIGSVAMGRLNKATGDYSVVLGRQQTALGDNAVTLGYGNIASALASTAIGYFNTAEGPYSTALGFSTKSIGQMSVSTGYDTEAEGIVSFAAGYRSTSIGSYSITAGFQTVSFPYASMAIGRYNIDSIGDSNNWVSTDPVFIIGNGTADNARSNAFVIYKNGNTTLEGKLTRPSTGSNNNLVPICYGSVSLIGAITSGTGNFDVTHPAAGEYEISIEGETYSNTGYITNLTPVGGNNFRVATTGNTGGNLSVRIFNITGTLTSTAFHFTVYKQ